MHKKKLNELKTNDLNPRKINRFKLDQLKESLKSFPKMMELRPIVIDEEGVILGGNMRFLAAKELGWDEVPVEVFEVEKVKKGEFVVKDNLSYGDWNWTDLADDFKFDELNGWGLDVPLWFKDIENSIENAGKKKSEKDVVEKPSVVYSKKALYLFYTNDQKNYMNGIFDLIRRKSELSETNEEIFMRLLKNKITR